VLARLGFLGAILDPVANKNNAAVISSAASAVRVEMIAANEEAMMAQHTARVFHAPGFLGRWQKERPIIHAPEHAPRGLALPRL
jgi:hypothetical protein